VMIGLDFDQTPTDAIDQERRTNQVGRDFVNAAAKESSGQAFGHTASLQSGHSVVNRRLTETPLAR